MLYNDFDPDALMEGLKLCGKFVLNNLNREHIFSNAGQKSVLNIKPTGFEFSLFAKFTHSNMIMDGGVCNDVFQTNSCIGMKIFDNSEIFNIGYIAFQDVPIFSPDAFLRLVKPELIGTFESFVDQQISLKKTDNKQRIIASDEKKIYKETKPELLKNNPDLLESLKKLSNDIYLLERVIDNDITFTTQSRAELYYDSEGSEIIQYLDEISIIIEFDFLNDNQAAVECLVVERFNSQRKVPDNIGEILMDKVLKEIELNIFYEEMKSGTYKILLQSDASDVFFHEAFAAHLLSGTYISEKISTIFTNRLDENFPKLKGIDIIMDPTLEGEYGSYKYDHEGVKSQKVVLMEDGTIKNFLTDKRSAVLLEIIDKDRLLVEQLSALSNIDELIVEYIPEKYLKRSFKQIRDKLAYLLDKDLLSELVKNVATLDKSLDWRSDHSRLTAKSNGHSRVQWWVGVNPSGEYQYVPSEARMSNLIIQNNNPDDGESIEDFAIKSCKKDDLDFYLSVNSSAGQIDVENGTFVITPSLIKKVYVDGREDEMINPGTFSMSLEDFLKAIEKVAHENEVAYGQCGASSGFVPVGSYTPKVFVGHVPYQAAPELEPVDDTVIDILQAKHI
jgi:predicted Zn-dependent protease